MEQKSINLLIADTKQKLINLINESGMPPILWSYLLKDTLYEIQHLADQQLQQDLQQQESKEN